MLSCVDSYEIAEWMAYERAFGPIGPEWRDKALASIHEQLMLLNNMFGEVNFKPNPVSDMEKLPLPNELHAPPPEEAPGDEEDEEDDGYE